MEKSYCIESNRFTAEERIFLMDYGGHFTLMGGAVRDTVLNLEVKDFDFFAPYSPFLASAAKSAGFKSIGNNLPEKYQCPTIYQVYESDNLDIILLNEGLDPIQGHLEHFPCDISMIYANGFEMLPKGLVIFVEDIFVEDLDSIYSSGIITCYVEAMGHANVPRYLLKLLQRFPDHKFQLETLKGERR